MRARYSLKERKAAAGRIGGFSNPSKMPCLSWSIPAQNCNVGARLAKIEGSVCSSCYALKGRYVMPNVQAAMTRRLTILRAALQTAETRAAFVADFVDALTKNETSGVFRFHDSGDVQSLEHFDVICAIARALPDMRFWIPTREAGIVRAYQHANGPDAIPSNLTVRVSAPMIDVTVRALPGCVTSAVYSGKDHARGFVQIGATKANACVAPHQEGHCRDCRACWDRNVETVAYHKH